MHSVLLSSLWHWLQRLAHKLLEVILGQTLLLVLRLTFNLILKMDNNELKSAVRQILKSLIKENKWLIDELEGVSDAEKSDIQKSSAEGYSKP